ncbi:hypothetical protein O3M35_011307 [Rhynocoris fuscipes]|uniref:Uncharacterized protein n=1 Tax=Rhynocoris fuscipes TaxID=488301 RepID=A0AAW1CW35_9HEMI
MVADLVEVEVEAIVGLILVVTEEAVIITDLVLIMEDSEGLDGVEVEEMVEDMKEVVQMVVVEAMKEDVMATLAMIKDTEEEVEVITEEVAMEAAITMEEVINYFSQCYRKPSLAIRHLVPSICVNFKTKT